MAQTTGQQYAVERVKPPKALVKASNPIFSWLLRSPLRGLIGEHLMLLHFRGRKTGRSYKVVRAAGPPKGSWVFSPTALGGPTFGAVRGWK
jgi:hypothetical protein